jgi:hypothetical protein
MPFGLAFFDENDARLPVSMGMTADTTLLDP